MKDNAAWLAGIPSAFIAVSLTAVLRGRREPRRAAGGGGCVLPENGLDAITRHAAGALRYTQYDYFKRLIMKLIAKQRGGATDTTQDREYTDWDDLAHFVDEFFGGGASAAGTRS
ncbi:MAG: hypothetical protein IPH55_15700 [Betaproteobacteria bacterium]|nr:hypothetical protein [Betaproteobacteria bacterium]